MNRLFVLRCILALFVTASVSVPSRAGLTAAPPPIRYDVSATDPPSKKIHVTITIDPGQAKSISLAIPVWTPGYYQILNFQRDISDFKAVDSGGHELTASHIDDQTWQVTSSKGPVKCSYDVRAEDAGYGFFRCHLDDKTGYVNGSAALMYLVDGKDRPATITYHVPKEWKVACSLDPLVENSFRAANYDELVDCPAQLGAFEKLEFDVKGTPFSAILVGTTDVDRARLKDTLTRISRAGIEMFHYSPFKRYYYLFHFAVGSFGGGLEHRNSTVLNIFGKGAAGSKFPWASLIAHEYFHAWNVKRIRPSVLGPFDYTQKVRSGAIWFCEGVTDYYSSVLMRTAGITSADDFLSDMAGRISQLDTNPARLKISAEEASRKGWEGGSMGFGGLDYYNKGSVLGFLLDVEIRAATANARSLDDVMRLLDEEYGKKDRGYAEDGLLKAINRVAGRDLTEFYNLYVRNPGEIAWNEILAKSGLLYGVETTHKPFVGFSSAAGKEDALTILLVVPGSPAAGVGLKEGDVVTALDGAAVKHAGWQDTVSKLTPDQQIKLGIRRGDNDLQVALTVGHRDNTTRRLTRLPNPNAVTARVLEGVLRSGATLKTSAGVWKYASDNVLARIIPYGHTSLLPNSLPPA